MTFRAQGKPLQMTLGAALLFSLFANPVWGEARDETAGRPFPVRELGVSRSFPARCEVAGGGGRAFPERHRQRIWRHVGALRTA